MRNADARVDARGRVDVRIPFARDVCRGGDTPVRREVGELEFAGSRGVYSRVDVSFLPPP